MLNSIPARFTSYLGALFLLAHCSADKAETQQVVDDSGAGSTTNSGTGSTGSTSTGATAGTLTTGGTGNTGTGAAANTGGTGNPANTGGTGGTGNPANTGGTGNPANTGGQPAGGGGDSATGGADPGGTGGADLGTGGGGSDLDVNGKGLAAKGETTAVAQDYLRLGEIRILNNNWGSAELGCSDSSMSVFVNTDSSFGWNFARGDCADNGNPGGMPAVQPNTSQPDFPQVEFGVHPFGAGSADATSPDFSSTTLLPIQIKDLTSASVNVDNLSIQLGGQSSWNIAMEFWLSERDPINDANPAVHTEVMAWWGWNTGRWACGETGGSNGSEGDNVEGYTVCHQSDTWADNRWRYYQFRNGNGADGSSSTSFNGTVNVKAFIDYLINNKGYSGDLWLTRMEVGSEIDDMTDGTVKMNGITFEVNGESRSAVLAP